MKTDQEPAVVALLQEVHARVLVLVAGNSVAAHSATKSMVENAARRVTGMTRALRSALVSRLGHIAPPKAVAVALFARHAAMPISLYSVDGGGRSPTQRARGQWRPQALAMFRRNIVDPAHCEVCRGRQVGCEMAPRSNLGYSTPDEQGGLAEGGRRCCRQGVVVRACPQDGAVGRRRTLVGMRWARRGTCGTTRAGGRVSAGGRSS